MESHASVVAIVDDDLRVLEALRNLLESVGYSVRTYSSGAGLLAASGLDEIECLISDIGMPVMDGFELARLIRVVIPGLCILFITGRPGTPMRRTAAACSDSQVFEKPFDIRALLLSIGQATGKHR